EAEHVEPPQRRVPETALHDDAQMLLVAANVLVEPVLHDVAPRGRQAPLELLRLHLVRERRQVDAVDAEARRDERRAHADGRPDVVLALEGAAHVTGPDTDREEDRLVAGLREAEAFLDEAGKGV